MLNSIRKDKNRRTLVKRFEIRRLQNKVLSQDIVLSENLTNFFSKKDFISEKSGKAKKINNLDYYSFLSQKTSSYPRNSSKNRVKNRCIETGRSKAVLRFCKLSRICLRDKASKGSIPGVNKASW